MANQSIGQLSVKITANTKSVEAGLRKTNTLLRKNQTAVKKNSKAWQNWSIKTQAANLALSVSLGLVIAKTIKLTDAFTNMTNKLKLTVSSTEELTKVTDALFKISNDTRASVESTVDLYTKMFRATKDLGIGQARLLKITESINKAFAIGGATTAEAAGAIRQLGQALASGTLRGDEFNSIAEQAPIIMEALKEATGKSAGELREWAATGAISAKLLIDSMEAYADTIDKEFGTAIATFGQKMEVANNEAIKFIGNSDDVRAAVGLAGDAILLVAENLDLLSKAAQLAAITYGVVLTASFVATTTAAGVAATSIALLRGGLALLGGPIGILVTVIAALVLFTEKTDKAKEASERLTKRIKEEATAWGKLTVEQLLEESAKQVKIRDELTKKIKIQEQALDDLIESTATNTRVGSNASDQMIIAAANLERLNQEQAIANGLAVAAFDLASRTKIESGTDFGKKDKEQDAKIRGDELRRQAEKEARQADNEAFLQSLRERFASESELLDMHLVTDLERLNQALADETLTREEWRAQQINLTQKFADDKVAIQDEEERAKQAIINHAINGGLALLAMSGKKGEKLAKKIAVARAVIAGGEAAVHAWDAGMSTGGPWAPLVAAGYTAASLANTASMINSIKGSGRSSGGGSRGLPSVSTPSSAPGGSGQQQQNTTPRNISINLEGTALFSVDQVRELITQINDQVGDGVQLNTGT